MSRIWTRIFGGVAIAEGNFIEIDNFEEPARNGLDMLALGSLGSEFVGGDEDVAVSGDATGDFKLRNWIPHDFDNTSGQWTGTAATLVARYEYLVRVSNGAITVTPKVWYAATFAALLSAPVAATLSGEAACSATDEDYSGTDQFQLVDVTIPSGAKWWAAGFTIGGTPAAGYQVWARARRRIYIQSTP